MSYLLLTPLRAESAILSNIFKEKWSYEIIHKASYEALYFSEPKIYLALGGHGKVEMALKTQFWITQLPDCQGVICAGSAGSLNPSLRVGDIVVGSKTIEHDYKQLFIKKSPPEFPMSEQWKLKLQDKITPPARWGVIASGDEDILSPDRRKAVFDLTAADAVAWEGAGAARASAFLKKPFCEIRTVTDNDQTDVKQDFTKNLNQAMLNLGQWLLSVL